MKWQRKSLVVAVALLFLCAPGCGGKKPEQVASNTTTSPSSSTESSKPTVVPVSAPLNQSNDPPSGASESAKESPSLPRAPASPATNSSPKPTRPSFGASGGAAVPTEGGSQIGDESSSPAVVNSASSGAARRPSFGASGGAAVPSEGGQAPGGPAPTGGSPRRPTLGSNGNAPLPPADSPTRPSFPGNNSNSNSGSVSFVRDLAPWMVSQCGKCHVDSNKGKFAMPTYDALMASQKIIPNDVQRSEFVAAIVSGEMPKGGGRVSPENLEKLKTWINEGARFDGADSNASLKNLTLGPSNNSNSPSGFANSIIPSMESESLRDRAVTAFRAGNTNRAIALFQAHALHVPREEATDLLNNYRWDKHHKMPRLGYSFAVGLILKNPGKLTELKPVGTPTNALLYGGAANPAGGGRGPAGNANRASAAPMNFTLDSAAGEYAKKFLSAFSEHHAEGTWSEAFREYDIGNSMPGSFSSGGAFVGFGGGPSGRGNSPASGSQNGPPAGYSGGGGGAPAGYSGGGGPPAGYSGGGSGAPAGYSGGGGPPAGYSGGGGGAPAGYSGGGGPPAGYGGGGGGSMGRPGAGSSGAASGSQNGAGGSASGSGKTGSENLPYIAPQDDALNPTGGGAAGGFSAPTTTRPGSNASGFAGNASGFAGANVPQSRDTKLPNGAFALAPGLTYIGSSDSQGDLVKKANADKYDGLILFEVDVSLVRQNNMVKNDTRIRVLNLKAEKDAKDKVISSTTLNNREMAMDKDMDEKIDHAVKLLLKRMSDSYSLAELPKFPADLIINKRLPNLLKDKDRSRLEVLSEINLYFSLGILDDAAKTAAFEKIVGADGRTLSIGTPEQKLPILDRLVAREFD